VRVAELAEEANHHPTWTNNWNTVEIWLISHSAGDQITDADRTLATDIDRVAKV
jgi:4a-hydroxytetrahydrobiopterin dehydratase